MSPVTADETKRVTASAHRIKGTGEAAQLIRELDWSATILGPIEKWSEALLIHVNMILAAPIPMQLLWGPEMIILYNDALADTIPGKHPHILGTSGREAYREAWPLVGQQLEDVLARGIPTDMRGIVVPLFRGEKIEEIYWDYSYSAVFDPDGNVAGILDVARDVTEGIRAEAARRASEQQLNVALDSAEFGIWWYDSQTGLVEADQRMHRIFGAPALSGPVDYWIDLLHPQDSARVKRHFEAALQGQIPYELEYRIVREDGVRWLRSKGRVIEDSGGRKRMFAVIEDITKRKLLDISFERSQAALLQNEKLAAVGRLAASISHEINNPLESVTNLIYLIQHSEHLPEIQEYAQVAERELRRVSLITNQTLRFYKQSTNPAPAFCYDLISETLSLFQGRLINSRIEVEKRKRAERPVRCFDGEIRQVLSNLIANAIDAMPLGGRLLVRSREGLNHKTGDRGLVLTVADTGTGMSPAVQSQLFEPFFSTKGINGTGLGLWVCSEIVRRHHGALRLRSSQRPASRGSVFTLFLPFDAISRDQPAPAMAAPDPLAFDGVNQA